MNDIELCNPADFIKAWRLELSTSKTYEEAYEKIESRHMAIFVKNGEPKRKYSDFKSFDQAKRQFESKNGRVE